MIQRFVYEFEDDPAQWRMASHLDPPNGAKVLFEIENQREIWISGNRAGWMHLAKICAEMAMRSDLEIGDHIHRSYNLTDATTKQLEVSFEFTGD
jgi:hypothetical protein